MARFALTLFAITATWALCQTPTVAQDTSAEQAPFTWKTSGETLEDFKVELVPTKPLDQSSAKACVTSFLHLADGRSSSLTALGTLESKIAKIVSNEIEPTLKLLLAEDLVEAEPSAEAKGLARHAVGANWELNELDEVSEIYGRWRIPLPNGEWAKISGSVVVEGDVEIRVRTSGYERDGIPTTVGVPEFSFLCRQDSTSKRWQIVSAKAHRDFPEVQLFEQDRDWRRELSLSMWHDVELPFRRLAELGVGDVTTTHDDVPSNEDDLIEGFFQVVIARRALIRQELERRVLKAWVDAATPLFFNETVAATKQAASDANPLPTASPAFEIMERRDNPLSVVVQMNDPQRRSWLVFIRKKGDGYQITKLQRRFTANRLRDNVKVEFLEDADSIWDVAKEPVLTSYQLPIFLVG